MERLNSIESLGGNSKFAIFGDSGNNLMANLESFKMVYPREGKRLV